MALETGLGQYPRCLEELPECRRVKNDLRAINASLISFGAHEESVAEAVLKTVPELPLRTGESKRDLLGDFIQHFDLANPRFGKDTALLTELTARTTKRNQSQGRKDPPPSLSDSGNNLQ